MASPGFLQEIDRALTPHTASLWLIVVDDASSDATRAVLEQACARSSVEPSR